MDDLDESFSVPRACRFSKFYSNFNQIKFSFILIDIFLRFSTSSNKREDDNI